MDKCAKFGRYLKKNVTASVESVNPVRVEWTGGRISNVIASIKKPIDIESEEYSCYGTSGSEPKDVDLSTRDFGKMLRHVAKEHWKDMKFTSYDDAAGCIHPDVKI